MTHAKVEDVGYETQKLAEEYLTPIIASLQREAKPLVQISLASLAEAIEALEEAKTAAWLLYKRVERSQK